MTTNSIDQKPAVITGGESRQAVESAIGAIKGNRTTKWEELAKDSPVGKWGAPRVKPDDCDSKAARDQG